MKSALHNLYLGVVAVLAIAGSLLKILRMLLPV